MTVKDLHQATGISAAVLYGYEAGKTKPGAREITLICKALKVTPNVLLFGTERPFGNPETPAEKLLRISQSGPMGVIMGMFLFPMAMTALDAEQKKTLFAMALNMLEASNPKVSTQILDALDVFETALTDEGLDWGTVGSAEKEVKDRVMARVQDYMQAAKPS